MPDNVWNFQQWARDYDWSSAGEEWSGQWGNSEAQWIGSLYPRLHRFFPAGKILELAPGFGRWTQYLLAFCNQYEGVDYSDKCIDACKTRFANVVKARFHLNDGRNIPDAVGRHFDFIFCFDSFVHVELDVLEGYLRQCLELLSDDGVAFIHHSNLLTYGDSIGRPHSRAPSVSGNKVAEAIARFGGKMLIQETINWNQPELIDCLTLFSKKNSKYAQAAPLQNGEFMREAALVQAFQRPYQV